MQMAAPHRCSAAAVHLWQRAAAFLCLVLPPLAAFGQGTVQEGRTVQAGSTLHVSTRLMQIPVLILSNKHQPLPSIPEPNFQVVLGKEAPFRPRLVRLEGEDPITLAILLDGASADSLLPQAAEALVAMVRQQLRPHDRVAIYASNGCKLLRLNALGTPSAEAVRSSVQHAAATAPYNAYARDAQPCPEAVGLWDAVDYMAGTLAGEPGRRVVLAITNGQNYVGRLSADAARRDSNHDGVTVFAVAERYKVPLLQPVFPQTTAGWRVSSLLAELTEGSGGMIVESTRNDVTHAVARFVELLRGRYIVEFQPPPHLAAGVSNIDIRCGLPKAFIRPAGTSLSIAGPALGDAGVQPGPAVNLADGIAPLVLPDVDAPADTPKPVGAATPAVTTAPRAPAVPQTPSVDITDESVPVAPPLPAGTTVK